MTNGLTAWSLLISRASAVPLSCFAMSEDERHDFFSRQEYPAFYRFEFMAQVLARVAALPVLVLRGELDPSE